MTACTPARSRYGGLVNNMPKYAVVFMLFTMSNVGLPGTAGFVGEMLTLVGAFKANTWVALIATSGVILSAAYALWLYRRVVFGELTKDDVKSMLDLSPREIATLAPLVVLALWMGIYPGPFLDVMAVSVKNLLDQHQTALAAVKAAVAAR
jgi:NADH-quinone oxidoreductase subunit M